LTTRVPQAAQIDVDDEYMEQSMGADASLNLERSYKKSSLPHG